MTDSVKPASDDGAFADFDFSDLPEPNSVPRNPKLATVLKTSALLIGLAGFIVPTFTKEFQQGQQPASWVGGLMFSLISAAILLGIIGTYYGRSPNETRILEDVKKTQANLKGALSVTSRINEEIVRRATLLKLAIEKAKRYEDIESASPAQVQAIAQEAAVVYEESQRHRKKRQWSKDALLLVAGFVLGVLGNWVAAPLWELIR